jgi:drug/metabolite transporter (DMT)-like permease
MHHPATTQHRIFPRADRFLFAITLIWGSTFSISKFALAHVSPLFLQGTRFALAALIVGIYTRRDIRATTRASLRGGVILGVFLGLGFAFQTVGLASTSASRAGFLTGTMVVLTPLFQMLLERRMPTVGNLIGVALVAAGLFVFTDPTAGALNAGDLLVLACAVVFALYIVYLDVFTREAFHREIVFYQFVVTALLAFAFLPVLPGRAPQLQAGVVGAIVYLAVFASVIAIFVQSKYQRESTPTRAAIIFSLEPVFAAIIAAVALGERMGRSEILGAAMMGGGVLVSELWGAMRLLQDRRAPDRR